MKSFNTNNLGLYNIHGNVWEWVQDRYGDYILQAEKERSSVFVAFDPQGPSTGFNRVVRGGGWSNHALSARLANRNYWSPESRFNYGGFRLVRTPKVDVFL